jgi:hypothetical protein
MSQEENNVSMVRVPDGASDVVVIRGLFRHITLCSADSALEK